MLGFIWKQGGSNRRGCTLKKLWLKIIKNYLSNYKMMSARTTLKEYEFTVREMRESALR
jgi:hypothetical protein